jgi:predicted nucleotidyltransferase
MQREETMTLLKEHYDDLQTRFGVQSLGLFGSVLRGGSRPDGDIDILVDFGGPAGFGQYMDLLFFLEDLLGSRVDLVTLRGLREELRADVEREAVRVA